MTCSSRGPARCGAAAAALALAVVAVLSVGQASGETTYSPPTLNDSYLSRTSHDARGLLPLYDVAGCFLRAIQKKDPLPPGFLVVKNGALVVQHDAKPFVDHFGGVLAVVVVGGLLALAFPVGALLWCCASCCCGGRGEQEEKTTQPWIRASIVAVLACAALSGAVLALAANAYLDSGIKGLPSRLRDGVADVHLFVDNAMTEVDTLMNVNYGELSATLQNRVTACRNDINGLIDNVTSALPVQTLDDALDGIEKIRADLKGVQNERVQILGSSQNLAKGVQNVAQTLQMKCGVSCPADVTAFIDSLVQVPPFPNLSNMDDYIKAIDDTVTADFDSRLKEGLEKLNQARKDIDSNLNTVEKSIRSTIAETGTTLGDKSQDLKNQVGNATKSLTHAEELINDADKDYLRPYDKYRFYACLAIAILLLVIVAAMGVGLLCGCCSKRHSYSLLKPSLWLISLTITLLFVITTALFLAGLAGERVCEGLRRPEHNQIIALLDDFLEQSTEINGSPIHNISYLVSSCRDDQPLYQVLDLGKNKNLDIDQVLTYLKDFDGVLNKYMDDIHTAVSKVSNVDLLPPNVRQSLLDLQTSPVANIPFDDLKTQISGLDQVLASFTPEDWASRLDQIGTSASIPVADEVDALTKLQKEVESLHKSTKTLTDLVDSLKLHSSLGHDNFSDAVQSLVSQMDSANDGVKKVAPEFVKVANSTVEDFRSEIEFYLQRVVDHVKKKALKCKPLSNCYDATASAVCEDIVHPWNGFWAGAGFSLLLFVPAAFLGATMT